MAQSEIGLRFKVDASQGKSEFDTLSQSAEKLREKIAEVMSAPKDQIDFKELAMLHQALDNATSARGHIMQQVKQSNPQAQQNMANALMQSGAFIMFQSALSQLSSSIVKTAEAFHSAKVQKLSGDYMGAHLSETRAKGDLTGDLVGTGLSAVLGIVFKSPQLAAAAMSVLNPLLKHAFGENARQAEITAAGSQQYKNVLPQIDALNQLFGGAINTKTREQNNADGLAMYGNAARMAEGTGLSTQDFIEAVKETGAYGVKSEAQALHMAQDQAKWARFTGAELSAIQKYSGTAYRYAGETNGASTAYAGMLAQNMGKGQYTEFLNSMSRIMEEGIAKGFVRSSKEVAGNMAMLYKLSGNSPLWQGEQGAQRLSQMNNAIANATNLENVEDFISFGVARKILESHNNPQAFMEIGLDGNATGRKYTGDIRADTMQMLEGGVSAGLLGGQFNAVNQLERGSNGQLDVFGAISRFKTMYGLNYTGAAQVYGMMQEGWDHQTGDWKPNYKPEDYAKQIEELRTNPLYQSDSEKLQAELNKMNANLVKIGNANFSEEMNVLKIQAGHVADIWAKMNGGNRTPDPMPGISEQTMRSNPITQGGDVMGLAHYNTVLNINHLRHGTEGLENFYDIQEKFKKITEGVDTRFFAQNDHVKELGLFMHSSVADMEFSNRDNNYANELLRNIEISIAGLNSTLRTFTAINEGLMRDGMPLQPIDMSITLKQ